MTCRRYLTNAAVAGVLSITASVSVWAQPQDEPTWLLVVSGTVTDTSAGQLALATSLRGVAFTDRPERTLRFIDIPWLVAAYWSAGGEFRANPPNASLIDENSRGIAVVEITDAAWTSGALHLDVALLEGDIPAAGDFVALTIDSVLSDAAKK